MGQPILVGEIVKYLTDPPAVSARWAYTAGALVVVLSVVFSLAHAYTFHPTFQLGMRIRTALAALIYQKVFELLHHTIDCRLLNYDLFYLLIYFCIHICFN